VEVTEPRADDGVKAPGAEVSRGARFVPDRYGWHELVRAYARTTTVRTGYSRDARIALHKILEWR
jgi:hypothetical protein